MATKAKKSVERRNVRKSTKNIIKDMVESTKELKLILKPIEDVESLESIEDVVENLDSTDETKTSLKLNKVDKAYLNLKKVLNIDEDKLLFFLLVQISKRSNKVKLDNFFNELIVKYSTDDKFKQSIDEIQAKKFNQLNQIEKMSIIFNVNLITFLKLLIENVNKNVKFQSLDLFLKDYLFDALVKSESINLEDKIEKLKY